MSEMLAQVPGSYYIERCAVNNNTNILKTKKAIKKAFQYQLEGKGYSLVEIVTSCPTNWGLDTLKSLDFLREKMFAEYPLGVFRDKGAEEK
jgi:2-oxoglutarate ferredoxin oxidoreductase subunit beta